MTTAMVKRIGLFGGPLLGLLCYYLLPSHYSTNPSEWVEFTPAGRATLALMVWMAGWWLTEAVDIETTALLPIVTFPPTVWLLGTRVLFRADIGEIKGGREHFDEEYSKLGPLARGEKIVLAVFSVTAFLWIFSPLLKGIAVAGVQPLAGLSDTGSAMLAAMALFVIPVDRARGTRAMDWGTAVKLPWGVLMLY
jgi:di/tricarboxylate transporter